MVFKKKKVLFIVNNALLYMAVFCCDKTPSYTETLQKKEMVFHKDNVQRIWADW